MSATLDESAPPASVLPSRRRVLRWVALGAAGLLLATASVTWNVVTRPRLSSGYLVASTDAVPEVGSVTGTDEGLRLFVDAPRGSYYTVVRNEGRTPVRLDGGDVPWGIETDVRFARILRPYAEFGTPVRSITVAPGEEVQLLVTLRVCTEFDRYGYIAMNGVDARATTWGRSRTVHLDVGSRYGFYGKSAQLPIDGDCAEVSQPS